MPQSIESSVHQRYAAASQAVEPALCCPVSYAGDYLAAIPEEIIAKDYGCGDPSPYVQAGDVVVDLGAGAGKLCYIMAQVVGPQGRVIGVDCNPDMLALSRKYLGEVAGRIGYANVEFRYGMIQDLQLNLELLEAELQHRPLHSAADWVASRTVEDHLRHTRPLIPSESVDCVVSNCVLNLVRPQDRRQLFSEIFRVLKAGGRAAISDIVADEDVPLHLQQDGTLWSGCLSGAYREDRFLEAFVEAGFHGVQLAKRQAQPWQTVEGIEFRSATVLAYKGKPGAGYDLHQAVVYKGPFTEVRDELGRIYPRGQRVAVGDRTFRRLQTPPYAGLFEYLEPREPVSLLQARPFVEMTAAPATGGGAVIRTAAELKGAGYSATQPAAGGCCGSGESC